METTPIREKYEAGILLPIIQSNIGVGLGACSDKFGSESIYHFLHILYLSTGRNTEGKSSSVQQMVDTAPEEYTMCPPWLKEQRHP